MKGIVVFLLIVLVWTISFFVGEKDAVVGTILGMAMVQPFLIIALLILCVITYTGFRRFFNEDEKVIAKFTEDEKPNSSSDYSDLYLVRNIITNDLIEYQILNKEKLMCWSGRCNLKYGKIYSMILCSGDENQEITLQVSECLTGVEYLIKDNQSAIGSIKINNKALNFDNVDNISIYTAISETIVNDGLGAVADCLLSVDTLQPFSSGSKVNYFTLKGENNEVLGKYYTSLKNIDLTTDINKKFDKRIAAIFCILIDSGLAGNLGKYI